MTKASIFAPLFSIAALSAFSRPPIEIAPAEVSRNVYENSNSKPPARQLYSVEPKPGRLGTSQKAQVGKDAA